MTTLPWEDNLLERKVESDLKDLPKTIVAFANSVRPGHIAVILIGERDDGTVAGVSNPDNIQKRVREECDKIYPPVLWRAAAYEIEGKACVRIEIEYSNDTPHFGGPAWIRKGSETIKASDECFQKLIDLRSSLVRELSMWIGKEITIYADESTVPKEITREFFGKFTYLFSHRWSGETIATIVSVNSFWVTFQSNSEDGTKSEPLSKLTLTFDDKRNQLKIIIAY